MVRLNDLNNFIETSSFSSISLASKKMEISQPALSESIGRLERDLGFKLFYRTKNGISLTPQGRKTLESAKNAINLIQNLSHDQVDAFSTVVLGCHAVVGSYFLPAFFSRLESIFLDYRIHLRHDLSRNIQMEIQAGKIDLGIVVNAVSNPDLIIKKIAEDRVCVWKARKKKPQNQVIADLNLFQTQSIIKKWSKAPRKLLFTESLELIARMTNEGCGYGILPMRMVKLLDLDLVEVSSSPEVIDHFSVVHRPEFGRTRYEKEILKIIQNSFN